MSKRAETLCKGVDESIRSEAITLADAVFAMQEKIENQIPIYKKLPLAQTVTKGDGEKILRNNPAAIEFRALVRDYSAALNTLDEILQNRASGDSSNAVEAMRLKFKVVG